jgi:hypothetical protein
MKKRKMCIAMIRRMTMQFRTEPYWFNSKLRKFFDIYHKNRKNLTWVVLLLFLL